MDPIMYNKIMCSLTTHNFRGKHTIPWQPNMIFLRATYGRLQAHRAFVHPNIRAKYEGCEARRPNHSRTPTHSRTTRSLYVVTWKALCHPNVLPLLGVTMSETRFMMVSEWMVNGDISEFVNANINADWPRLVSFSFKIIVFVCR